MHAMITFFSFQRLLNDLSEANQCQATSMQSRQECFASTIEQWTYHVEKATEYNKVWVDSHTAEVDRTCKTMQRFMQDTKEDIPTGRIELLSSTADQLFQPYQCVHM